MSFSVTADAYDRFMGRYSGILSPGFADFASVKPGMRALDVGCGPGALTGELVERLGPEAVAAVDPSASFAAATAARFPGVDVRQASAEKLPFADGSFDVALAQLVVHFLVDPIAGIKEMTRVNGRPGGIVAACVWDHGGGGGPLATFWSVVREFDGGIADESHLPGTNAGELGEIFIRAGLHDVVESSIAVNVSHKTFEEWWDPFTLGVGPAGAYVAGLSRAQTAELRESCHSALPTAPFVITAKAWAARGFVGP